MVLLCFRDTIYAHGFFKNKTGGGGGKLIFFIRVVCVMPCLVPVRRFPSPSRSIRFGDVSEANGRETFSHGPRDPKRFGREEK